MLELKEHEKIVVYNENRQELGEGTFLRRTTIPENNMIAYECQEHTILAKGPHYVRIYGRLHFVSDRKSKPSPQS